MITVLAILKEHNACEPALMLAVLYLVAQLLQLTTYSFFVTATATTATNKEHHVACKHTQLTSNTLSPP